MRGPGGGVRADSPAGCEAGAAARYNQAVADTWSGCKQNPVCLQIRITFTAKAVLLQLPSIRLLEQIFNALIYTFIDNKVGIANGFLNPALSGHLRSNLERLYEGQRLKSAGTGNDNLPSVDNLVRGDKIYWLDREHNDPYENEFFGLMDAFVLHLNSTCYTGITGYEFHYALYEAGSFYKKHIDQFRNDDARQYSMILYLNEGWVAGDGGELCIYHEGSEQYISPESGKSVFFKSSGLAHEVMLTHKARISITGWLKKS